MKYDEKDVERECEHFSAIAQSLVDLKRRKAHDYGNSWRVFGLMGIVYQIGSKFIRIWNLTNSKKVPNNEALRDSFRDISVYAIMAQQMLDEGKTEDAITDFGHAYGLEGEQLMDLIVKEHEENKKANTGW